MAAELGQQTVEFSALVRTAAEESYLSFKDLIERSKSPGDRSDSEKKIDLLKFIVKTRQRMLRLHVLAKWCQQVPLVHYCQRLASTLSSHDTCFTQTADSLFFMHEGLQQARAPLFDVPSAIEVLLTRGYRRLPKCIEDIGIPSTLPEDQQKQASKKLDTLLRSKLLEDSVPKEFCQVIVSDGTAVFYVNGEFKVFLTLGYRGHLSMWRILHLELLVGEKDGLVKLEETRRYALGDDLERRMASADNPLMILYTILHDLCVALVMDTVVRQVRVLLQGRWKDAIRFELVSDGSTQLAQDGELDSAVQKIPVLKIIYWLDFEKNVGGSESGSSPFMRIETGQDQQIKCIHSSFVLDPLTDREAEFSLDQSCIDVEQLLLRAISCNRHTRLLEIQRELSKNVQIGQSLGDIILKHDGDEADANLRKKGNKLSVEGSFGNEVLRMRAHGTSYITLGINIRNGRFLLQSSENILSKSALLDFEEALNLGTMTATDVFLSLKRKSILHLFASSGRFLGLKVYEKCLNSLKMPKSLLLGSDFLLMGFPNCRSSYYLLMQLDKDFKSILNLLEVQPDVGGKSHSVGDCNHILRSKIIDLGKMQMVEDELNHSVLDWEKLHSSKVVEACNKVPENVLLPMIGLESPLQLSCSRSRFSSIVDEVFELENGVSRSSLSIQGTMIDGICISEILSPVQTNTHRLSGPSVKQNDFENSSTAHSVGFLKNTRSSSWIVAPISSQRDIPHREKTSVKRSLSDILERIPSFQSLEYNDGPRKRRKISESQVPSSLTCNTGRHKYGSPLADVKHSLAPSNIYVSILLHVVRHCSLCIKHAQLTSQMASLEIPYVEEVGLQIPSSNLWFRLPFARDDSWQNLCLHLGKPGSMCWDVKVNDPHFRELWDLQKGSTATRWGSGVRTANTSDNDSHIHYEPEGVILCYKTMEADSIQKLVSDLRRLSNARLFARGMRDLIGVRADSKVDDVNPIPESKTQLYKGIGEAGDRLYEQMRKTFKIEAVGLMSLWFSYGAMPVMAHFVVEWEAGKEGCTMHVSPDHLWPHTKFLEDFVNGAEVASFLDCIRLTAGPLLALASAIPPARTPGPVASGVSTGPKPNTFMPSQGLILNPSSSTIIQPPPSTPLGMVTAHSAAMLSAAGRGGSGIFPSSLLPIDVSIVLRGPYWIRIIYRKKFSVDMRCFAGDQVWLQPATPPKGGPSVGGSLPCPQFRPFIMEHVAQGLNALEPNFPAGPHMSSSSTNQMSGNQIVSSTRPNSRPNSIAGSQVASSGALNRASNATVTSLGISGLPLRVAPATGVSLHVRGELNTAFIGLGDDGGYGGGWVPLAALKKVLRGILKYLGVLWLFAQLPDLLKEILGSILKENEGALLNLDQEQPALRFFVGSYVFAVSVHRVQLLLQVVSVKRFHHQQASQQQAQLNNQEELSPSEINEICDYFSRRVASEPYDASRVASFITLLTLPISVLREFLKLISWKKGLPHPHGGEIASAQRARVELCLENHSGSDSENSSTSKSNIHHDRVHYFVDFALTFVLDPAYIPHVNAAGGAAWLPYCVSVRLRYSFGESSSHVSFLGMDGSHGGRACWLRLEEWEKCKQRVAKMVDYVNGSAVGDAVSQGRLKVAAETLQKTLQMSLQQPRDSALSSSSAAT